MRVSIQRLVTVAGALVALGLGARPVPLGAQQATAAVPPRDSVAAISLDDAMKLALARSEIVRIAQAGVTRARGQLYQARSQFMPQLNGTAAYQKTIKSQFNEIQKRFGGGPAPDTTFTPFCQRVVGSTADTSQALCPAADGFGAIGAIFASPYSTILGLTGQWNVFTGGRTMAGYRASTAGQRAAETGLAAQQAQVRYDVAQAYFDAQLAGRLATIAESSFVQAERAFRQTSLARQVGNVSEFEMLRARVTRDNVEAQRQLLRVARGQRLPAVQLSTNYQRFAYPADFGLETAWAGYYPNWTVTLGVSLPLFTGGRIRGEEMVAQANLVEAREQLAQAEEGAALDAQLAVAELRQAQTAWAASYGTADQAARAYTIAEVRYREGVSTQLELSESRVQVQQALANRALAARNLQVARMRLALIRDLPFQLGQGAAQAGGTQQQQGGAQGGAQSQQGRQAQGAGARQAAGPGGATTGTTGTFQ